MTTDAGIRCAKCQHRHDGDHAFYSDDFARYYAPSQRFALTWCYHCAHVLIHRRPLLARVVRLHTLRFKAAHSMRTVGEQPLFHETDPEIGLFAGAHLMRMVWHCFNRRVAATGFRDSQEAEAMHLALKKLPARYVALMAAMTVNAPMLVPLERQIMEGTDLSARCHRSIVHSWIGSSPDSGPRELALCHFEDYFQGVPDEG